MPLSPCANNDPLVQQAGSSNLTADEGLTLTETSIIRYTIPFSEGNVPYLAALRDNSTELIRSTWLSIPHCDHVHLIVDSNVKDIGLSIADNLMDAARTSVDFVNLGERDKRLETVTALVGRAVQSGITRRSAIAAVGGGLVSNLGGMVAGLLYRGIPLLHFPTTLLNAFDAVLSQKQAVNFSGTKNILGMYKLPSAIAVNFSWFATLPERQIKSGLAELYKNALVTRPCQINRLNSAVRILKSDPDAAFDRLLRLSIDAKSPFLELDGREHSAAIVFEYGHTVGHALEASSMGQMSHGEAVAWGMLVAAQLGYQFYNLPAAAVQQHSELLTPLLTDAPGIDEMNIAMVADLIIKDNKRGILPTPDTVSSRIAPMVLLSGLGSPVYTGPFPLVNVPTEAVLNAIQSLTKRGVMG